MTINTAGRARPPRVKGRGRLARKGQAEVIGGLIIITIILVIVLPILLNSLSDARSVAQDIRDAETRVDIKLKERLQIRGATQEEAGSLWPAIWIVNTGTVEVVPRLLYLIDRETGSILMALDLAYTREGTTPIVRKIMLNPDPSFTTSDPIPPAGEYIVLRPGDRLFISLDPTHPVLQNPEQIIIRVLSAEGVLHPIVGGGEGEGELVPPPEQQQDIEAWKGAFSPYAGFKLNSGEELLENGTLKLFQPSIELTDPIYVDFSTTFIYDDDSNPGLYKILLIPADSLTIRTSAGNCPVDAGDEVYLIGFVGSYHFPTSSDVYIDGYLMDVIVNGSSCLSTTGTLQNLSPGASYEVSDFDGNGVNELAIYSYRNGPNYTPYNPDIDDNGTFSDDAVVWSYIISRDISGQNFVRITTKINYYWTQIGTSPDPTRNLRTFMIAVWEYDPITDSWVLRHYRDFSYTNEKPKQYQITAVFPLERDKVYRVGFLFFDNYKMLVEPAGFFGFNVSFLEFTYAVEYIVVEYGRFNPLFSTTPPIYIIAIPDPTKINNIGEAEYANLNGISTDDAKIQAQDELLGYVTSFLENVGIIDYVVIRNTSQLCTIMFSSADQGLSEAPPRNAVVIWLQGDADIFTVSNGCADDITLRDYIVGYNWVFVQVSGEPMWGSLNVYTGSSTYVSVVANPNPNTAELTSTGIHARSLYSAFRIPLESEFAYMLNIYNLSCIPSHTDPATGTSYDLVYYYNSSTGYYGASGLLVGCGTISSPGIVVVNPVDIDWARDGGGMAPDALAEVVVTIGLEGYKTILQLLP